jgi:hypothetical protein
MILPPRKYVLYQCVVLSAHLLEQLGRPLEKWYSYRANVLSYPRHIEVREFIDDQVLAQQILAKLRRLETMR